MSYATVMVHVDAEGDSTNRINVAVDLSDRYRSTLIGIGGWSPGIGFATDVAVIEDDPVKLQTEELVTLMTAAERGFREAARDISHAEWRGELGLPLDHLVRQSRSADLVIIGRERTKEKHCVSIDPGAAILRMGRPVLVVPNSVQELSARRVVVAWKECREARRAVRDALGLLRDAEEVLVVKVSENAIENNALKRLDDVANYLKGYRVPVTNKVFLQRDGSIASTIIGLAQREACDLIVAGAYGHSRLGEWVFGGVTIDLLERSPICCLLAH
jgi:nucleotide-binding universal stress UspA family protein